MKNMENQHIGRDYLREAWSVCRFKGGLDKKERHVLLRGVDAPIHTMLKDIISPFKIGGNRCQINLNKPASFNC